MIKVPKKNPTIKHRYKGFNRKTIDRKVDQGETVNLYNIPDLSFITKN